MGYHIYHNFEIKSDLSSVYNAIALPEELVKWWPLKCSGLPKEGEVYNFNFTDDYNWYAKVKSCKQDHHIHYKMTASDADWNPTTFGLDLLEKPKSVLVKFWHKDWPNDNDHYKKSSFCWALLLNGLKNYLEKGIVIPFEERS
nr:SRPBCC domain-containing protein [Winogradskyella sp.]